jgi:septum formation protein
LALLEQIGIRCELLLADAFEDAEGLEVRLGRETPARYVQRVTSLKLDAAVQRHRKRGLQEGPILCADTTVALGSTILGKPGSDQDAAEMLLMLSGRTHRVLTAVALQHGSQRWTRMSESKVRFASLSASQIAAYIATREPFGKAGGYAIQGRAACLIADLRGSFSGVMGLPLYETAELLRQANWPAPV